MQGGENWILQKEINANRYSWDSSSAGYMKKPLLSLYGTEWRDRDYGLGRSKMQNWILQKEINANRFSGDSHRLDIWKTTFVPLWDRKRERGYGLGRSQMQGGKNWILPKEINANRFFWDSHWLEIWSNNLLPSVGLNGGTVAMASGDLKCREVKTGFCRKR
jgi:hypothetical protein